MVPALVVAAMVVAAPKISAHVREPINAANKLIMMHYAYLKTLSTSPDPVAAVTPKAAAQLHMQTPHVRTYNMNPTHTP
jgi:hypothetical protein